jgi:hypothetical protein
MAFISLVPVFFSLNVEESFEKRRRLAATKSAAYGKIPLHPRLGRAGLHPGPLFVPGAQKEENGAGV